MKKMLIACLTALLAVAAQAQDIMVVHPHEAAPQQFEVANIDSMTWENATTLHIYLRNQAAQDFAIANVDSLTWLVISTPEPPITVGQVELGEGEAFVINDSLTEVRSTDCTVRFSPTVVEESTKLVIRRATSVPPVTIDGLGVDETYDISQDAVAVDVTLGDLHELDGIVEIRIPLKVGPDEVPGVAWYNEETMAWEPIEYEYDTKTGEVVVWSNHLSIIECYRIKGEHTNNARLEFYSVPFPDNSVDDLIQMVNDAVSGTVEWADYISNWYGVFSTLGFDITWSALNAGGVESKLFEETSEKIGNVGTLFAIYDILRAGFSGDDKTAGINTMKYLYSQVSSALSDAIGTSIMSAAMCSVAIIDYALNKLYEQMISDRHDLYLRSYQRYYSRNTSDGLKHHYRSAPEWYRLLLPAFKKGSPTIEAVNNEVDQIVDDYVNEFWNLPDDDQILFWLEVGGPRWSYTGGLNNDLKKELADNHKAELYRDVFPRVFDAIGRDMRTESYNILYDSMKDYAKLMNQVIRLELAGQAATEGTRWEGCKVRFKELPSTITDPANWESKLSAEGKGSIRFRFFAYTSEGVKPTLELVDYNGNVVREIPITICEGVSNISLGAAPATPYLIIDKETLTLVASGGTKSIEVKTNMTTIGVSSSVNWIKAEYDANTKTLSIKADANKTSEREGIVTITGYYHNGSIEREIKVKQAGKGGQQDDSPYNGVYLYYNLNFIGNSPHSYMQYVPLLAANKVMPASCSMNDSIITAAGTDQWVGSSWRSGYWADGSEIRDTLWYVSSWSFNLTIDMNRNVIKRGVITKQLSSVEQHLDKKVTRQSESTTYVFQNLPLSTTAFPVPYEDNTQWRPQRQIGSCFGYDSNSGIPLKNFLTAVTYINEDNDTKTTTTKGLDDINTSDWTFQVILVPEDDYVKPFY